jgi:Na+/H+ antiporter NhaA
VLAAALAVALVWANISFSSYEDVWTTQMSVRVGTFSLAEDLRYWVNDGLLTFFFFVVGLEARREFDLGELRDRRRVMLPLLAALGGMAVAVAIYLAFNSGRSSATGWGAAMSTDTAFALGVLALAGPSCTNRLRAFIVTVVVVDDLVSLVVIATVYTKSLDASALAAAIGLFAVVLAMRRAGLHGGTWYLVVGIGIWVALFKSGVDPVIVGLAMGLMTYAYSAPRDELERASDLFRNFREQPTPEAALSARRAVRRAISPNLRLQQRFHPWSSYVIVPLFALANGGIVINGDFLSRGLSSPITLGIALGYVVGKPLGVLAGSWLTVRLSRGRLRPPVGWGVLAGGGGALGVGFTVSILIASREFGGGAALEEAKLGVILALVGGTLVSWTVMRGIALLPPDLKARAVLGRTEDLVDLATPVDPEYDHTRGPADAPVTLVEYADFECPYCGQAESEVRALLERDDDLQYVWRHLPLTDVHPHAELAALASEAAAKQGAFWEMHNLLLDHQGELEVPDLARYAEQIGLDVDRFLEDLRNDVGRSHIERDVESADLSNVSGTPTFFVNGKRHYGAYDLETLREAVAAARARARLP